MTLCAAGKPLRCVFFSCSTFVLRCGTVAILWLRCVNFSVQPPRLYLALVFSRQVTLCAAVVVLKCRFGFDKTHLCCCRASVSLRYLCDSVATLKWLCGAVLSISSLVPLLCLCCGVEVHLCRCGVYVSSLAMTSLILCHGDASVPLWSVASLAPILRWCCVAAPLYC